MKFGTEEINLNESYEIYVKVKDGVSYFAGELKLTPERVTLKVMGEETEGRKCGIKCEDLNSLICKDLNCTFFLMGLKAISARSSVIGKKATFFQSYFEVDYVLFFYSDVQENPSFYSLAIKSQTIADWVGNTLNQGKIIKEYKSGASLSNKPELMEEFSVPAGNDYYIRISYPITKYHSSPDFKAGISFAPLLHIAFRQQKNAAQTILLLNKLYDLFAFLTGGELELDKIVLHYRSFGPSGSKATLYYPRNKYPNRNSDNPILFPLGQNLRFGMQGLPEFPLESFNGYFVLDNKEQSYFHKYVRYRRLQNVEERFLGYFRVLESLCHKEKSYLDNELLITLAKRTKPYLEKYFRNKKDVSTFLNNLPRFNRSKYNTEKCLRDFFIDIPVTVSGRWIYQKDSLYKICKLRNDISHANDHNLDETDIEKMAKFCEIMLVIALFIKLGISIDTAVTVISRIGGYRLATEGEI